MNTPNQQATPNRRENDNFELERFKSDIDLVRYATERHGYTITAEGRNGQWHHLEKGPEKVLVTSARGQEYPLYKNLHDERDAGSIIEFAQNRGEGRNGPGLNLGEVRKELRAYLGEVGPEVAARPMPLQQPERQASRELPPTATEEERREALIRQVLGAERGLTDRTYLHSRHLTNETIESPAFQNRVFTSQENRHQNTAFPYYNESGIAQVSSKNQEAGAPKWDRFIEGLPKEGVWVSNPTEGKGTKVERVVISESPLDAMSYHQLNARAAMPNTMYVATGGTPTEKQGELIQKIIDRQQPREVTLANDRDPSGSRYNINYLNDLSPARKGGAGGGQEVPESSSRPVEWHATSEGKYHNKIKVEFHTDKAHEGRTALSELSQRVASINAGQNRTGEPASLQVEVVRTSSKDSVARVVAPLADSHHLVEVSKYLHQQREAQLPAAERQAATFIRIEQPITKDYNQDLALTVAGKSPAEIQAFAEQQQRQYLEEKILKQQQENEARRLQEQQRQAEVEAAARERRANSPEAAREREREDRAIGGFIAGAVAAEVRATVALETPPGPAAKVESLESRVLANLLVQEPIPRPTGYPFPEADYAQKLTVTLEQGGATVTPTDYRPVETYRGVRETELLVSFERDQPGAASLSRTLDELRSTPGLEVREYQQPEARAQFYAAQPEAVALVLPERAEPLTLQRVIVETPSREEAVGLSRSLGPEGIGATVSPTWKDEGMPEVGLPATYRFDVSYRTDQPELPRIHALLETLKEQEGGNRLIEYQNVGVTRGEKSDEMQQQQSQLNEAGRTVSLSKAGTSSEAQAELRVVGQELQQLGMRVGPVETERGMATVEAGYRVNQPELGRISEALQEVGGKHQVLLYQEPGLAREREQVLAELAQTPTPRWSQTQVEQVQTSLERQLTTQPYGPDREVAANLAPAEWNRLTVIVENGAPSKELQQALEQAGARVREGVAGTTAATHYPDGTSSPAVDYRQLHVAYPPASEKSRPEEVQQVLEKTHGQGQTLLLDRFGDQRPVSLSHESFQERWKLDLAVQPSSKAEFAPHPNGGGLVQSTAQVEPSVYVGPQARVTGTAVLEGQVRVEDYALVGGNAHLSGRATVREHAVVLDGATLRDAADVSGQARVSGRAVVEGEAQVTDRARVGDQVLVKDQARISEQAQLSGQAQVGDQGRVVGNGQVSGQERVEGNRQVGEPNPPVPDFTRVAIGVSANVYAGRDQQGQELSADQRQALLPATVVEAETRRSLQQQAPSGGISADARSWATGFHEGGSVLPPDHAGSAEKYLVLRYPTPELAQLNRLAILSSGGHEDVHVGASLAVGREGQKLQPTAQENDHELRVAYSLNGRSLPLVHAALEEARAHPELVRVYERPLDTLDRAAEVARRPALEQGAEVGREVPLPRALAYEAPGPATRAWLETPGATAALEPQAQREQQAEKLVVIQIVEPSRADQQHPAAEQVRQQLATSSLASAGPVLPVEAAPGQPAGLVVSEVRVAYHLGQQDLPDLARTLHELAAKPHVFVEENLTDRRQRLEVLETSAAQAAPVISRDGLVREGVTEGHGFIRVASLPGQEAPEAYAGRIQQTLEQRGATVQEVPGLSAAGSAKMLEYSYPLQQPHLNALSRTLDEFNAQPGVRVQEPAPTEQARQLVAALSPAPEKDVRIPDRETGEPARPQAQAYNARGEEKLAIVHIDEVGQKDAPQARGRAEEVRENLQGAGASVGSINSTVDDKGIRHSEMLVSYRTDSPNIAGINKQLDAVPGTGGSLTEHPADISQRQNAALNAGRSMSTPAREASPEVGR